MLVNPLRRLVLIIFGSFGQLFVACSSLPKDLYSCVFNVNLVVPLFHQTCTFPQQKSTMKWDVFPFFLEKEDISIALLDYKKVNIFLTSCSIQNSTAGLDTKLLGSHCHLIFLRPGRSETRQTSRTFPLRCLDEASFGTTRQWFSQKF